MEKQLIISLSLLFLFSFSHAQWEVQTSGTNEFLRSVYFIDTINGWVAGAGGIILHTANGGINWEEQSIISNHSFQGIHFTDANHGWAVGRKTTFPFFRAVYHTIDGGNNWEEVILLPVLSPLHTVYFRDMLNGWMLGSQIYHTIDGGETWESQFYSNCEAGGIYFTDSLKGWVAGSYSNGSTGYIDSFILHTFDGGNTWEYQFEIHSRSAPVLFSIYFTDSLKGWIAGGRPNLSEIILKTTDGGNNWDTSFLSNSGSLNSIYFTDTFNGWAVGAYGNILYTSDAGYTWEYIPSGTENTLSDVYFTENGYGWAVGGNGTILHADYSQIVGIDKIEARSLSSNVQYYPNPFTTSTTLSYELKQPEKVILTIYDYLGKQVYQTQENQADGKQQLIWNAERNANGVYYYRLQVGDAVANGKLVKVR